MNTRLLALPVVAALSLTAAYGTTAGATTHDSGRSAFTGTPRTASTSTPTASPSGSPSGSPTASPVGRGCKSLPSSGPGSPSEMSKEPVATAAEHIPELSTFADIVKKAGLVDTLNSASDITVFAPNNDAFKKIPKADLDRLTGSKNELTKLLTYHVVQGRKTPADLEKGQFTTLEGGKLTTSRSGDTFKVGNAEVVCGNLQTSNATVYIIDSVLKPGG
ncbi:fasciclin domain-containing protein [Sphaerisporangium sp. NBC_01403]|uniref:fasciclin domain-containing protein n=1 Tax=Sphaerisporangium sp. NBC_01403 TaxID=2903599 RepID=UPI0032530355